MINETEKLEKIKLVLKKSLDESEHIWESKEQSAAFIVGYLQGSIKTIIEFINDEMVTTTQHEI